MKQREGVVLILAMLCILALEVSAAGLHYATMQELRTSRSAGRDTAMRLAARSAVARVLSAWPADMVAAMPIYATAPVPAGALSASEGITATADIERIGPNAFLIRATAVSQFGESVRVGALAATADPQAIAASFTSAVRADGPVTLHPAARITDADSGCPSAHPSSALLMAINAPLANAGSVTGRVVRDSSSTDIDRIGALDRGRLQTAAAHPDSSIGPLRFSAGDTIIDMLTGSGVLVIHGNVNIRRGSFNGVIIVVGSAWITGGARLNGSLIVTGGTLDLEDAAISYDACAVLDAVRNPRVLGPFRPRGRMWIPLF